MNTPSPSRNQFSTPPKSFTRMNSPSPPIERQTEITENMSENMSEDPVIKFVMIGENAVGKSNLALRFSKGKFDKDSTHTVGFEFQARKIAVTSTLTVSAQIWDTAGQERFSSLTSAYLRGACGIYLVYDITNRASFEAIPRWIEKIHENSHPNAVRSLIGNKLDQVSKRKVSTLEALTFAQSHNLDFCEVSAATSENVEVAMRRLIVSVGNSLIEQDSRLSLPNLEVNSSLLLDLDGGSGDVSLPRPTLSKLPRGWVEVKSGIYESVWTGDRETVRPKEEASKGQINYSRPQSELEKINVSFAGIKVKGTASKKKSKKKNSKKQFSKDDEGGISFGLHGAHSKPEDTGCGNRPFVKEDKLGVEMTQNSEEEGEVQLLNSDYTTNRFAFTYSWWTAFNYERYVQSDEAICKRMKFVGQEDVYNSVGQKIKADLMDGNPVVLFAYGLSGSGKTFTVFGPDAADSPDAWFKHDKPHPQWGVFPHLAYDMFNEKQDGWKFTMKYFQNVVDIVRDLMSPMVKEQSYKSGMRKDKDGFMDIEWCEGTVLKTWDDLREQFQKSNEKKAISPTQFNHQSTRGHCIMTLEVEMPMVDNPSLKQKGRVYVCDLAGTEPAGDIFYALYEKKTFPNGDVEHILKGPHKDQRKTKELQDQGKKINLSLSEMAQFFMKMAEAVKKKTLKPGKSIPGCNSYFLCKYLKDTMLQARTYLFCAIRPEVQFLNYTFATLGFAKNASVIKLAPKKATVEASAGELKLMAELAELKALVAELQSGDGAGSEDIAALLAQKQAALANQLAGGDAGSAKSNNEAEMKQQAEEYGRRGISLSHFEKGTKEPYFVNLDEDPFRSNRFMYLLTKDVTVFGPGGDIKPLALSVVKGHCSVERHENNKTEITEAFTNCTLVGGAGETIHNGKKLDKDARIALKPFDRVAIGGELLLYRHPEFDPKDQEPMSASNAIEEYQKSLAEADNEQKRQMDERMKAFEAEKDEWRKQQGLVKTQEEQDAIENAKAKEEHDRAMAAVDREILELLPKTKELKKIVGLLDRDQLSFDVTLQRTDDPLGVPTVKVKVINGLTDESIIIDPFEFIKSYSIVKDETSRLSMAIESGREYEVSELNDPLKILFDNTFQLGTCTIFPEYLIYGLSTDEDEVNTDIKNCSAPYNNVGKLEVTWVPLETPDSEEDPDYAPDIDDDIGPADLLGKPWTYKIKISSCSALPITVDECYVQYTFNGVEYTTETLNEQDTHNPAFEYTCVHHVESVDQEFLDYLMTPLEINLYCSPAVRQPKTKVSTTNSAVVKNLTAGVMVAGGGGASGGGGGGGDAELERLRARVAELETENARLIQENEKLKAGGSAVVKGLEAAKALDTSINA